MVVAWLSRLRGFVTEWHPRKLLASRFPDCAAAYLHDLVAATRPGRKTDDQGADAVTLSRPGKNVAGSVIPGESGRYTLSSPSG